MEIDLSVFKNSQLLEISKIVEYYANRKITQIGKDYFDIGGAVKLEYNPRSELFYLVDEDYQVLAFNPNLDLLDLWVITPDDGNEGFIDQLLEDIELFGETDQEYIKSFL